MGVSRKACATRLVRGLIFLFHRGRPLGQAHHPRPGLFSFTSISDPFTQCFLFSLPGKRNLKGSGISFPFLVGSWRMVSQLLSFKGLHFLGSLCASESSPTVILPPSHFSTWGVFLGFPSKPGSYHTAAFPWSLTFETLTPRVSPIQPVTPLKCPLLQFSLALRPATSCPNKLHLLFLRIGREALPLQSSVGPLAPSLPGRLGQVRIAGTLLTPGCLISCVFLPPWKPEVGREPAFPFIP